MRAIATAIILLVASTSLAADKWLSVSGGYNTYDLGGMVADANQYTGYEFDAESLDSGLSLRVALDAELRPEWTVGAAYEAGGVSTTGGSDTLEIEAECRFHSLQFAPTWYFHRGGATRIGVGAEIGLAILTGSVDLDSSVFGTYSGEVDGGGFLGAIKLVGEVSISPRLRGMIHVGYRNAPFDDVEAGVVTLNDYLVGEDTSIEFSGAYVRAGLGWRLP